MDREPLLWTQNLSVRYGQTPALRDVTMSIYRGCITAIVGPSGCGKSTFLSCLNRMTDLIPDCQISGKVTFDQVDVFSSKVNVQALRRRIGMIFQKPNPFPLSIRKNLTFALKHHGFYKRRQRGPMNERVESALRDVGLWEEVKDRLDKPAMHLSGGQQQRLCLARALVLEPEVVLMDEPCSALDPIASGVVEDLIVSLRTRYTVVVVTHNLAQARRIADDAALFWVRDGAGCLVERGPARAVFESPQCEVTSEYVSGMRA